jgi:hypothetical protein
MSREWFRRLLEGLAWLGGVGIPVRMNGGAVVPT